MTLKNLDTINFQASVSTASKMARTIRAQELGVEESEVAEPSKRTKNRLLKELNFSRKKGDYFF